MRKTLKIITIILTLCLAVSMLTGCSSSLKQEEQRVPKCSPKQELSQYTWEEIKDIAACGLSTQTLRDEWHIKAGMKKDGFMLVDDDGNSYLDKGFIFMGPINQHKAGKMNQMAHNQGGFLGSNMKTILATYYTESMLDTAIGNATEFVNVSCMKVDGSDIETYQTRLFIPSIYEVGACNSEEPTVKGWIKEGQPFDYFESNAKLNRINISKICLGGTDWWLRTPSDAGFGCINSEGNLFSSSASNSESVIIAFVVGEPNVKK